MDWVVGIRQDERKALVLDEQELKLLKLEELSKFGLPKPSRAKRLAFQGDFLQWKPASVDAYMQAYGITMPVEMDKQHSVYCYDHKNIRIVVPALAFMRAFFKPAVYLLERMFSPANVDTVSFIDHAETMPTVVIDDAELGWRVRALQSGVNKESSIRWLQLSRSARRMAQSVHIFGSTGSLGLTMPLGTFRMTVHGLMHGKTLYVNKVSLVEVMTEAADSITGAIERFAFHETAKEVKSPLASISKFQVPRHRDGSTLTTHDEWIAVRDFLKAKGNRRVVHCQRSLLDAILVKISSNIPWQDDPLQSWSKTDLTNAFRRWVLTGRLQSVIDTLVSLRASAVEDGNAGPKAR